MLRLSVIAFAFSTINAAAEICVLVIDGTVHMEGHCTFEAQTGGDFVASDPETGAFAHLFIEHDGTGTGFWNAYERHAHTPLGRLVRTGGCWSNQRAILCAWRP